MNLTRLRSSVAALVLLSLSFTTVSFVAAVPPESAAEMEERVQAVRDRGRELRRAFEQHREAIEAISRMNAAATKRFSPRRPSVADQIHQNSIREGAEALREMFEELEEIQREVEAGLEQEQRPRASDRDEPSVEPEDRAAAESIEEREVAQRIMDIRERDENTDREFEAQRRQLELEIMRLEVARHEMELEMMHREFHDGRQKTAFEVLELLADAEVRKALSEDEIREKFDLGYHTKHVDTIFKRVFGG